MDKKRTRADSCLDFLAAIKAQKIPENQVRVLLYIFLNYGCRQKSIADRCGMSVHSVGNVIRHLESAKFIVSSKAPTGLGKAGRGREYFLTKLGYKKIEPLL